MKASLGNRVRTVVLVNFILCILIQFVWLAYASGHGLPVSQQQRYTPAFASVLIGPLVLAGYFSARRKGRTAGRILAPVVGVSGVYRLATLAWPILVIRPGPPQVLDADMALWIYTGLSFAAIAVFWRRPDALPMSEPGTPNALGDESDAGLVMRESDAGLVPRAPNRQTYTAEQLIEFQQAFRPVAERYRHCRRLGTLAMIAGFGLLLLFTLSKAVATFIFDQPFQRGLPDLLTWGMMACLIVGMLFWRSAPALFCPACGADLDEDIEEAVVVYCPECGSDRIRRDFLDRAKCESCGKTLASGKGGGRRHILRSCHICGLMLDVRGL